MQNQELELVPDKSITQPGHADSSMTVSQLNP